MEHGPPLGVNASQRDFQVKVTESANETFGAWREGNHDDLVLAIACTTWMAESTLAGKALRESRVVQSG